MTRPGALARALLLAALLGMAGCKNPFLPAQPQLPSGTEERAVDPDYATPEGVITTMQAAIAKKLQGNALDAYMGALADPTKQPFGITFDLDPTVVADRQAAGKTIPVWQRDYEKDFYRYLVGLNAGDYSLAWTIDPASPDVIDGDSAIVVRDYHVTATTSSGSVVDIAIGHAIFHMKQLAATPSRYVIVRWTDEVIDTQTGPDPVNPGRRSFSRLRIDQYNGEIGGTP